jgi:hypothetical protein
MPIAFRERGDEALIDEGCSLEEAVTPARSCCRTRVLEIEKYMSLVVLLIRRMGPFTSNHLDVEKKWQMTAKGHLA